MRDARREEGLGPRGRPSLLNGSDIIKVVHVPHSPHAFLLAVDRPHGGGLAFASSRHPERLVPVELVPDCGPTVAPRPAREAKEAPVPCTEAWDLLQERRGRGCRRGRGRVRSVSLRAAEEGFEVVLEVVELE